MKNIFLKVSHICYESHKQLVDKEDFGIILLYPVSKELKEVVVTGKKSPYTMKAGTLTANIQNSILNPNWSLEFSPFNFLMTAIRKCCLYTVVYQ